MIEKRGTLEITKTRHCWYGIANSLSLFTKVVVEIKGQSVSQLVVFALDKGIDELEHHKMALVAGNRHVSHLPATKEHACARSAVHYSNYWNLGKQGRKDMLPDFRLKDDQ